MRLSILLVGILIPLESHNKMLPMPLQIPLETQQIMQQISRNNPKLSYQARKRLAQTIVSKSKKHNVPPRIFTAILMQESGYRLSAVNPVSNDFGISQINHRNIRRMGLDKQRLVADLDYAVDTGAYILSNFRRYESREPGYWWVRYNCGNVKILGEKCKNYKKKVVRYL